jgi:hypothetical protein
MDRGQRPVADAANEEGRHRRDRHQGKIDKTERPMQAGSLARQENLPGSDAEGRQHGREMNLNRKRGVQ